MMVSEIPRHQTAWIFPGTLQPGKGQRAGGKHGGGSRAEKEGEGRQHVHVDAETQGTVASLLYNCSRLLHRFAVQGGAFTGF